MASWFDRLRQALGGDSSPSTTSPEKIEDESVAIPNVCDLAGLPSSTEDLATGEEILQKIHGASSPPVAFQALWDGDTTGWYLRIEMVQCGENGHHAKYIAGLQFGGDIRLFNGQVPPWPEAVVGKQLGEALARRFHVPFFFPSPDQPDDGCPNWWEQSRAIACADCKKPIIPSDSPYLPKDVCYHCHLARENKLKIRQDGPEYPNGVTILVGKDGTHERVMYSSEGNRLFLVKHAFNTPERETEARERGQFAIEGDDLAPIADEIAAQLEPLIEQFKPDTKWSEFAPEAVRKIEYGGRTLELNLHDSNAHEISSLLGDLKVVRQALESHFRVWFVFRRGMTKRADHLLRIVARQEAPTSIQQMVDTCQNLLDEREIRAALQKLEELGHVRISADEVRITDTGRAIL